MFADQGTGWPTSWEWNFEDGTHSETQNNEYNYTYNKAGNYNVSLKVTNANGTDSKFTTINVLKSTPEITWSKPDDIIYGTSLNSTQLDASASVDGTYTYTPASGTVLSAGAQTLNVDFTPTDTANYSNASKNVTVNVLEATPEITWSKPADIIYGTALNSTQLNASAWFRTNSVNGTLFVSSSS